MGKKKKRKVPAQKTQVPVLKKRSPRLGLPRCPECGRTTKYSQCAAKLPFFSISCRCGTRFRCRPGMMSCALWVLTLLLCFGMDGGSGAELHLRKTEVPQKKAVTAIRRASVGSDRQTQKIP